MAAFAAVPTCFSGLQHTAKDGKGKHIELSEDLSTNVDTTRELSGGYNSKRGSQKSLG
jgi:hypothetical protein